MKIVGFEAGDGLRLGVVEGDQVIDLQAVEPRSRPTSARCCAGTTATCRRSSDAAKRAPASPAARSRG